MMSVNGYTCLHKTDQALSYWWIRGESKMLKYMLSVVNDETRYTRVVCVLGVAVLAGLASLLAVTLQV